MKYALLLLAMMAVPASAQDSLNFDIAKLCDWQKTNNGMDIDECTKLETDAKSEQEAAEKSADATRKTECNVEAKSYSGDSDFASHTVYVQCLKNGSGSL
jgi:hypothetical protein